MDCAAIVPALCGEGAAFWARSNAADVCTEGNVLWPRSSALEVCDAENLFWARSSPDSEGASRICRRSSQAARLLTCRPCGPSRNSGMTA
jgi:hypothetical protein